MGTSSESGGGAIPFSVVPGLCFFSSGFSSSGLISAAPDFGDERPGSVAGDRERYGSRGRRGQPNHHPGRSRRSGARR